MYVEGLSEPRPDQETPRDRPAGRRREHRDRRDLVGVIEGLGHLDLEGLRQAWRRWYGVPPTLLSVELLRLMLAWRLQAEVLGGLGHETRRRLARTGRCEAEGLDLGVGAALRREWNGRKVEVVVLADGFRWEGQTYPSLSAAASAIAGSPWNGPRFFGLRRERR